MLSANLQIIKILVVLSWENFIETLPFNQQCVNPSWVLALFVYISFLQILLQLASFPLLLTCMCVCCRPQSRCIYIECWIRQHIERDMRKWMNEKISHSEKSIYSQMWRVRHLFQYQLLFKNLLAMCSRKVNYTRDLIE